MTFKIVGYTVYQGVATINAAGDDKSEVVVACCATSRDLRLNDTVEWFKSTIHITHRGTTREFKRVATTGRLAAN